MSIPAVSFSSSPARCGRLPGPEEAKLSLPGCAFASATSSLQIAGLNVGGDHQHFRHGRDQRYRRQILQRVVGDGLHAWVDGERAGTRDRDGVAIRRRLRHRIGADHAALPAAIVDHDRLFHQLRHALADHPRDDVIGPAGRERHDQFDGLCRKILRRGQRGQQQRKSGHQRSENSHRCLPLLLSSQR